MGGQPALWPDCPSGYGVTGGPSTCGLALSAAVRRRVACSCPGAASLAPAEAIAREWLTSAGCRACARGGRRTGRGCRTYWSRTLIIADAVASAPLVDGGWLLLRGPGRNAGVSETQDGLKPAVALAVAGRRRRCWRGGREPLAGSVHSPRRDTATGKCGDEISHMHLPFVVGVARIALIGGAELIRKRNLRQAAAVSQMLPLRHRALRDHENLARLVSISRFR